MHVTLHIYIYIEGRQGKTTSTYSDLYYLAWTIVKSEYGSFIFHSTKREFYGVGAETNHFRLILEVNRTSRLNPPNFKS